MTANSHDILSAAILHLQSAIEYLDEVAGLQDLFKHDYKQLIKRTVEQTEIRLNKIWDAMDDDEKNSYLELLKRKTAVYSYIDRINTFEAIEEFEEFLKK
ncbi:MAG: hypothetical protein KBA90_10020 [Chitinophagaceae bacterium]|nr:hypothetical protein [Chitinophagaceae bacterium]MBP7152150.1 hypothetical protein [Paludibacteraceae bacterium]